MSVLIGVIGLVGFIVCILLLIKNAIQKKPKKKVLIALCVCFVLFIAGVESPEAEEDLEPTTEIATTATPEPTDTPESTPDETLSFELIAGEPGEYGELLTLNKDTELEETYYIYRIPAGSYKVTNSGESMDQFSVYGDTIYETDEGWEELSDVVYVKALDVGESDTFTIDDNQIVEIHEPGKFVLETVDSSEVKAVETSEPVPEQSDEDMADMTIGQKNALRSAQSYLRFTAFSYEGLIDQLEYEQYSYEDAVFAADNCGADWDEQALNSALNYLEFTAFSYSGLIDQLEYEEFTTEQATYAADNCGADWNEQAAKSAESYLEFSSFSRDGLIDQLEYEGFTYEQAVYGVEANGY